MVVRKIREEKTAEIGGSSSDLFFRANRYAVKAQVQKDLATAIK